ncbi:MAG: hypothetical protein NW703_08415 [Nitrospiraceae bacterium]
MAVTRGSHPSAIQDQVRRKIESLRRALLDLHKALIEAERVTYERIHGRVDSTGQLLQLVMHDGWFTWLHPLSQLVVRIDELLDDKKQDGIVDIELVLTEIRALLRPSVEGDGFARSYYEALQRAPDVVLAHSQVKQLLSPARR